MACALECAALSALSLEAIFSMNCKIEPGVTRESGNGLPDSNAALQSSLQSFLAISEPSDYLMFALPWTTFPNEGELNSDETNTDGRCPGPFTLAL